MAWMKQEKVGTEEENVEPEVCPFKSSQLYNVESNGTKWPIVYHDSYNISFLGLQNLHPFDSGKWGKIYQFLLDGKLFNSKQTFRPSEPTESDLLIAHTQEYLDSLRWSINVARISEVPPVAFLPNFIVQRKLLQPLRLQTGGSVLAGKLAIERGWAINIGGGFHHCSGTSGGGFCAYADITLLIRFALEKFESIEKVLIVDLDAHQGNGYARDFMIDDRVFVLDVYNRNIYPHDGFAKRGINRKVELSSYVQDDEYLPLVKKHLTESISECGPQLIVYNAGTDILDGDSLGCLSISSKGIITRDEIVFSLAKENKIPIVMLTSGGYQRSNAQIIADSILSLQHKQLIGLN
uniref:Histone deacetylase 11 n=1 Tax=Ciona savignyi TaxID=51511 RepID=H2YUR2_CIOSA